MLCCVLEALLREGWAAEMAACGGSHAGGQSCPHHGVHLGFSPPPSLPPPGTQQMVSYLAECVSVSPLCPREGGSEVWGPCHTQLTGPVTAHFHSERLCT